jgi:DNA-binding Lrp family transcriptional regulator
MTIEALILGELNLSIMRYKSGELIQVLKNFDGVVDAKYITGNYNFYLTVKMENKEKLNDLVAKLHEINGIQQTSTFFVLTPKTQK